MKTVNIIGRRWFQRGPGNTYHSVQIIIDGQTAHKVDFAYGYGSAYLDTAAKWLEVNGHIELEHYNNGGHESLWQAARRLGFTCEDVVIDVDRKKDL